jgi:hypothetical protein
MSNYASGKDAYGISDRSGFRYRLRDMKTEWNGLKVGPDEYEPKHPQLEPVRRVIDPQALKDPRPDIKNPFPSVIITFPVFSLSTLKYEHIVPAKSFLGDVSVFTSENVTVSVTGLSSTSSLGSVTVAIT